MAPSERTVCSTMPVKPFKNQKYQELKQQCLEQGKLFEDPEFPASDASLFYSGPPPEPVEWKRPKELCDDPHLFVHGISSHDLHQGLLGNCWFIAACSCLALQKKLWQKVIPNVKEQDWDQMRPEKYAGIFHFHFWSFGEWIDVVVDDRLPTRSNELLFCSSKDRNEFWCALLEKAYAKLSGCYEALDSGNAAEAIVDFTGAVAESIDLVEGKYNYDIFKQAKLFATLLKVHRRGGLISAYIRAQSPSDFEVETIVGLVKSHAYSVTKVLKMNLGENPVVCAKSEKLFMIRLRNPWGKKEWNGAWSDTSEEWKRVSKAERKKLGLTIENDGEFWMTFEDWCKNFTDVDVCRIVNTSFFSIHKTWERKMICGRWTKNPDPLLNRAGGCSNNKATFLQNPQYVFDVKKAEDDVLISLQQKDKRILRKEGAGYHFSMGFEIFKVENNREYRMHTLRIQEKVATSTYIDNRMVYLKVLLKKGRYVLIPTTFSPGIEDEFILRMFTDVPSELRELETYKHRLSWLDILFGVPRRMTQIKIHSAEGLQSQDSRGGANPYIIIKCENKKVHSPVQYGTVNAVFNTQAVFCQRKIQCPIIVQVWHSKIFSDRFLGQALLPASPDDPKEFQKFQLRGRGKHEADKMPGQITITVLSSDDLARL
ncbi:calpain-6 isoform X2 [Varanus komodoensis]|uniref:calpain-6 isoform X2 n=1 Tax=Varanus komodoensis TaxID=61221 RepID=UPI001CF7D640|nr:calpain-6 isoform X2 [Varanus komodoensis]